jgi:tetratricopeptide (TPR) repeat protein
MQYPVSVGISGLPISAMIRFRKLCLSIALLACHSLAFSQTPASTIGPISDALRARDFDAAIELSRAALQQAPNNPQLWTLQGIAFASKGDNKQALAAFQQALKISPNNIAALAGAAQIEYQTGSQGAVPLLNHLLQLRPEDPTAHAMLAILEYRKGTAPQQYPISRRPASCSIRSSMQYMRTPLASCGSRGSTMQL